MSEIFEKIKGNWKKAALLLGLLLVIYFILDFLLTINTDSPEKSYAPFIAREEQFNRRFGSQAVVGMSSGQWAQHYGLTKDNGKAEDDPDGDGLTNKQEYLFGTDPMKSDTDGDNYSDRQEITNGYDPDAPGDVRPRIDLSIAKIGVAAPVVWSASEDEKSLAEDLKSGVIHYPATAAPGQPGNMVVSGHSSNYVWVKGNYNHIFAKLNDLTEGDVITATVSQQNGKAIVYRYKVTEKKIATPNDQSIFENSENPQITLTTCWPIGSNAKRLVIKAALVK